eukprot:CCRYP_019548-RA/>CCRYP_019548-RA protein AED:0.18 eAED:0.18 QI:0/0.5/0.66/1/0/0/3/1381/63
MLLPNGHLKCTNSRNPGINCRVAFSFWHVKVPPLSSNSIAYGSNMYRKNSAAIGYLRKSSRSS